MDATVNRVGTLVKQKHDFTVDEKFIPQRNKLPWPKAAAEAQELWRQRMKFQLLGGKLAAEREKPNSYQLRNQIPTNNEVLVAAHVVIVPANHGLQATAAIRARRSSAKGIMIRDDVWNGSGARILDGVTLGSGSVIAAGAVISSRRT